MLSIKTKNVVMVLIAGLVLTVAFAIVNECIDGGANAGNVVMGVPLGNTTIYVPDDYPTIQSAVENATDGDTIIVRDGNYTENVDIKKPLTVRSENGSAYTFVTAADSDDHIFEISSNYVNVSGFTVNGSNLAGVYLILSDCCNISDINASNNKYGFHLYKSSSNTIQNNLASDNSYGIFLDVFSSNNTVSNNTANNNDYGFYMVHSSGNIIQNNSASHNRYYGIYLWEGNSNIITSNNASNNYLGIWLRYSDSNTITNNNASNNDDGICLSDSGSNTITNNNASNNNNYGIYLPWSDSNTITNNNASNNNNYGIYLYYSNSNSITNNNVSNNNNYGIYLYESNRNTISNNTAIANEYHGIYLDFSEDNTISNNTLLNNDWYGIYLDGSNNNILSNNNASDNDRGICLGYSNNNIITNNTASNNEYGIYASHSSNGKIYLNNFISNTNNVYSWASTNTWNSTEQLNYTYKGETYENYMGSYWDDYNGSDADGDGIGDIPYSIDGDNDSYPLMEWFENYTFLNSGPTYVSGIISSNTTWTAADSPYIVTGSILVEEGVTLTIEPGVVVKFNSAKAMQIDGELIAQGTEAEPIVFTSNQSSPAPGDWVNILFTDSSVDATYDEYGNYLGGCIMQYCTVEYAGGSDTPAIKVVSSSPFIDYCIISNNAARGVSVWGPSRITNNNISYNSGGGIYAGEGATISHNTIFNNTASCGGGIYAGGTISHNTIFNNTASFGGGIYASYVTATISGNTITNNSASCGGGIDAGVGTVTLSQNIISNNSASNTGGGINEHALCTWTISGNTISNNLASNGGGIHIYGTATIRYNSITSNTATSGWSGGIRVSGFPLINYNNIYNNTPYDVYNANSQGTPNVNATYNWWGTTNESEIQAHIYDWYDDASLGIVDYIPYLIEPVPPIQSLTLGVPLSNELEGAQDVKYYQVWVNESEHLFVLLDKPEEWWSELGIKYGELPTWSDNDDWSQEDTDSVVEVNDTQEGYYYIRVGSNIGEGGAYNITTMISLPELTLGVPLSNELEGAQDVKYYQVWVNESEHLFVLLDKPEEWWSELGIKYGELPTWSDNDDWSQEDTDSVVEVNDTQEGYYYIRVGSNIGEGGAYNITAYTPTANLPPIAIFNYTPENSLVNQTVTFNASSSYDPDGNITGYQWDFGDGTNGTGMIVNHSYNITGNYTITLTVIDDDGLMNLTSKIITVSLVNLIYPTGGEEIGGIIPLRWASTNGILNMKLEYYDGTTWHTIATNEENDEGYDWNATGLSPGSNYKIRVTAMSNGYEDNATSANFSITSMDVTPHRIFLFNETATIYVDGCSGRVTINYPIDDGPWGIGKHREKASRDGSGGTARFSNIRFNTTGHWVVHDEDGDEVFYLLVQDKSPEITNVQANPDLQKVGGHVNITCTVTDNVEVDTVKVNVTYPDNSSHIFLMENIPITDDYYYNSTYSEIGTYYYFIWANDTSGNENQSTTHTFLITPPVITFVNITPQSQFVSAGETFTVNITINPIEPIAGAQADLLFDPSLITVNSVTDGGMFDMWFNANLEIDNVNGAVRNISAIDFGSVTTPGVFAVIEFTAGSIDGTSPLNLTNVIVGNPNGTAVSIMVNNGNVTVRLYPWDVNMDDSVNILDLIIVGQHWGEIGAPGWIRADVNKDGMINILDLILIGQHWTG